ncbi:MAG: TetR/AcrR family transcriptional regulator [Candidatus Promineifilaceae bacterium]|nr:TetR/AcrR family transcriptional regulator [Anaerolineaceae bacterium]
MPKATFFNLPEAKRQHIIELALAEFAENDFDQASISRIVARAGIAKGSFYQYFENKEDLHAYLLALGAEAKAQFLKDNPPDPQMGTFAYIRWLSQAGIVFELERPQLSQIAYRAVRSGTLPKEMQALAKAGSTSFFRQLVEQGQAHGDIDATLDPDLAAFFFNVIFNELGSYLIHRLQQGDGGANGRSLFETPEAAHLFNQALHILASGLGAKEPT